MTHDLSERLRAAELSVARQVDAAEVDPGLAQVLGSEVRRRRTRRAAVRAVGVAAAVLAVAVPVVALQARVEPPATTPPPVSPAPEEPTLPTPSPSESVEPPPEPTTPLEPVVVDGAPTLHRMPEGLLDEAGDGWVLMQYEAVDRDDGVTAGGPGRRVVVLADPAGTRFLVTADAPPWVRVVEWRAGTDTALVVLEDSRERGVLDLRTGEVRPEPRGLPEVEDLAGRRADGAELWWVRGPDGTTRLAALTAEGVDVLTDQPQRPTHSVVDSAGTVIAVSLDGSYSDDRGGTFDDAVGLVDLADGTTTEVAAGPEQWSCRPLGWFDTATLSTGCTDDPVTGGAYPPRDVVVAVDVAGRSAPEVLVDVEEDEAYATRASTSAGVRQVLVLRTEADDGRRVETWVWRGARLVPLWSTDAFHAYGAAYVEPGGEDRVLVALGPPYGALGGFEVWSVDTTTGTGHLVGPTGQGERPMEVVDWVAAAR